MAKNDKKRTQWAHVDGGSAFIIPVTLLKHENFIRLSPHGLKLMIDLGRQYTGFNNGYLWAGWSLLKDQGWKSKETLNNAVLECEHYRLILRTKQGGKNSPNYHALTWWPVHELTNRPLDFGPSVGASNSWKDQRPQFEKPEPKGEKQILGTPRGASLPDRRANHG